MNFSSHLPNAWPCKPPFRRPIRPTDFGSERDRQSRRVPRAQLLRNFIAMDDPQVSTCDKYY